MTERGKKGIEYERYLDLIRSLGDSKALSGLERVASEIEERWRNFGGRIYSKLVLNLCDRLSSSGFTVEGKELYLADKYALQALEKPYEIPLEVEIELLSFLQPDYEDSPLGKMDESEKEQRTNRVTLWLRAWQRLDNEIDSEFDFDDRPKASVAPPPGASARAGVAPEEIKDPMLRAEYEAAIRENARKAEAYNWQYELRQLEQTFTGDAEQYIVEVYTKPPYDTEELEQLLDIHMIDEAAKARILDAVEEKSRMMNSMDLHKRHRTSNRTIDDGISDHATRR
jgi:hypothetical protein